MPVKVESVTDEWERALGAHLEANIKGLHTMAGFPEANQRLKYPMIAISTKTAPITNTYPEIHEIGAVTNNKALVKYVTGWYDFSIQLDIFERSKEERHDLYEKFYDAFNTNFPQSGLKLVLDNYHGIVCSYQMTRYAPDMNENRSKTKEWRAIVDIEGNCKAIRCKEEYIISQTETTLDVGTDIVVTP